MVLGDEDKEFLRQLAWLYPADFMAEIVQLADALAAEQLAAGERQNIREIVAAIMAKLQLEAEGGVSAEQAAEVAAKQATAAKEVRKKVFAALADGKAFIPAGMGAEVIAPLTEALVSEETAIAKEARRALCRLTDGSAIDELCRLWADNRRPELEQLLVEAGYLAAKPLTLRLLTVLKTGADRVMLPAGAELIPALLAAVDDVDRVIAGRARQLLLTLTDRQAVDALCEKVLSQGSERLRNWTIVANYAPTADDKAALYYCITGQWEKYYALDWQDTRPLLVKGYSQASPAERQQFLAATRQSGHSLLLAGLLLKSGRRAEYEELTDQDWAAMLDTLTSQERWEELYRLILLVPANWAAEFVLTLAGAAWTPKPWQCADWENILAACPQAGHTMFVPDERQLAVLETAEASARIICAAFHPNGRLVAGGCCDGRLRLWQTTDGRLWRTVNLHAEAISALAFTPDGRYLVTAGQEAKTHIWQLPDVKWVSSVKGHSGQVTALAADETGKLLALAGAGGVLPAKVWSWDGLVMNIEAQYPGSFFCTAAVNPRQRLITGSARDGRLRTYGLTGAVGGNKTWAAHSSQVQGLKYSGDGRLLVSSAADDTIKVWQSATNKLLWSMRQEGKLLAVSQSGARIIIQSPEGRVVIKQLKFNKPLALATHDDWQFAAAMKALPALELETRQASCFLYNLLTAKFRYDIML